MVRAVKVFFAVLLAPAIGAVLLGCSTKATKTDATPKPVVSERLATMQPPSDPSGSASAQPSGEGELTDEQRMARLLASRGEDIPIKDSPSIEFLDPSTAERAIFKPVYFDYDQSSIKPAYQPVLEGISKWLADNPTRQVLVEGHCDERGTDEYNLALGERRALAVRRYLVALGVLADHVHTISYGEEKPAAQGSDEAAWSKNRRAEFKISAP